MLMTYDKILFYFFTLISYPFQRWLLRYVSNCIITDHWIDDYYEILICLQSILFLVNTKFLGVLNNHLR